MIFAKAEFRNGDKPISTPIAIEIIVFVVGKNYFLIDYIIVNHLFCQ